MNIVWDDLKDKSNYPWIWLALLRTGNVDMKGQADELMKRWKEDPARKSEIAKSISDAFSRQKESERKRMLLSVVQGVIQLEECKLKPLVEEGLVPLIPSIVSEIFKDIKVPGKNENASEEDALEHLHI